MTSFVRNTDGRALLATTWTPNGVPGPTDTFVTNGYRMVVENGETFESKGPVGADAFLGSSASVRGELFVENGGTFKLSGETRVGQWSELGGEQGCTVDLAGNDLLTTASGALYIIFNFVGTATNRITFKSDGGGAFKRLSSGAPGEAHWTMKFIDFLDIDDPRIGNCFWSGNQMVFENCLWDSCGLHYQGTFRNLANDWILKDCDWRNSQAIGDEIVRIGYEESGSGDGVWEVSGLTCEGTAGGAHVFRCQFPSQLIIDSVFDCALQTLSPGDTTFQNCYFGMRAAHSQATNNVDIGGFVVVYDNCALFSDLSNTHMFNGVKFLVIGAVIVNDPISSSNRPDFFLVAKGSSVIATLRDSIIQDYDGGVALNSLGIPDSEGTYLVENCTLRGPYTNYGALGRTENSNDITGDARFINNVVINTVGGTDVRGLNIESTTLNQVAFIRNNAWVGFDDPWHNCLHSTFTAGVDDEYGGLDYLDVDPGFVRPTVNYETWDTETGGGGTNQGAIDKLLLRNGASSGSPRTQLVAAKSGYTPADFISHMRAGFTPTNPLFKGTGYTTGAPKDRGAVLVIVPASSDDWIIKPSFQPILRSVIR